LSKACLVLCNARTGVQPGVKEKKSHKLNAEMVTNLRKTTNHAPVSFNCCARLPGYWGKGSGEADQRLPSRVSSLFLPEQLDVHPWQKSTAFVLGLARYQAVREYLYSNWLPQLSLELRGLSAGIDLHNLWSRSACLHCAIILHLQF
jgi:hypothetical protein